MDTRKDSGTNATKNNTTVDRKSDRELVVTRTFNGPAHVVFNAWTKPELFQQWWGVGWGAVTVDRHASSVCLTTRFARRPTPAVRRRGS